MGPTLNRIPAIIDKDVLSPAAPVKAGQSDWKKLTQMIRPDQVNNRTNDSKMQRS
jgi:hypothetical protein